MFARTMSPAKILFVLLYVLCLLVVTEVLLTCGLELFWRHQSVYQDIQAKGFIPAFFSFPRTREHYEQGPEIWFFGGSTLYGGYSSTSRKRSLTDAFSAVVYEHGKRYIVRNYGRPGFDIRAEQALFHELLRAGGTPEIVVFYDGTNEFLNAVYQHPRMKRSGLGSGNQAPNYSGRLQKAIFLDRLRDSRFKTGLFIGYLIDQIGQRVQVRVREATAYVILSIQGRRAEYYGWKMLNTYISNINSIEQECSRNGIVCYFIWQPKALVQKTSFSSPERALLMRTMRSMKMSEKARAAIQGIDTASLHLDPRESRELLSKTNFLYLGDLFNTERSGIYFDTVHLDESTQAHDVIARRIYTFVFGSRGK